MTPRRAGRLLTQIVHRVEDALLTLSLAAMVAATAAQILLRNFLHVTLLWTDPLVRLLVLWGGLIGALVAVREDKHIGIQAAVRFCRPGCRRWLALFTGLASAAVCALLAWVGLRFVRNEFLYGESTFLGLSTWMVQLIFPLAFAAMAGHFFARVLHTWRR